VLSADVVWVSWGWTRRSWKPVVQAIDERYDAYLDQERRVHRQGMQDNRVHCLLYFVPPTGHAYAMAAPQREREREYMCVRETDRQTQVMVAHRHRPRCGSRTGTDAGRA
jgi:hypothetical protein